MAYIWKERNKVSLFADNLFFIIIYLENPKKSTGQLLVIKISRYEINRPKSIKFLLIKEETQMVDKLMQKMLNFCSYLGSSGLNKDTAFYTCQISKYL